MFFCSFVFVPIVEFGLKIVHVIAFIDMALFGAAVITIHVFTYLWVISLIRGKHELANTGRRAVDAFTSENQQGYPWCPLKHAWQVLRARLHIDNLCAAFYFLFYLFDNCRVSHPFVLLANGWSSLHYCSRASVRDTSVRA